VRAGGGHDEATQKTHGSLFHPVGSKVAKEGTTTTKKERKKLGDDVICYFFLFYLCPQGKG
jgi:hypothetical protein